MRCESQQVTTHRLDVADVDAALVLCMRDSGACDMSCGEGACEEGDGLTARAVFYAGLACAAPLLEDPDELVTPRAPFARVHAGSRPVIGNGFCPTNQAKEA